MLKAAVVGVGHLGSFHAEKFARSKQAELVAVCDLNREQAELVASKFGIKAVIDYRELPGLGIECASVAVDTSVHFEVAAFLLANGIDVLVEKPISTSVLQAQELVKIAKENKRILQVGHLERFNPAFNEVRRVLTQPMFFESRRITPFRGRGADVDVVLDLMIHDIDIIAHLAKSPVSRIDAVGVPVLTDKVDIANARITFASGAVANITASRVSLKSERSLRIFQPNVYASLDYQNKQIKTYQRSLEKDEHGYQKIEVSEISVSERDALEDEIEAFLATVNVRGIPIVTGEDGMLALQIAEQIKNAMAEPGANKANEAFSEMPYLAQVANF